MTNEPVWKVEPLATATEIAMKCHELATRHGLGSLRGSRSDVHAKGASDVVTDLDVEIEGELRDFLLSLVPGSTAVGEESVESAVRSDSLQWIIDPIDGTINFSRGLPPFTSAVCLKDAGRALIGVVYDPLARLASVAVRGAGSHRLDPESRQLYKSKCVDRPAEQWLIAVMLSPTHSAQVRTSTQELIEAIIPNTLGVRVYVGQAFEAASLASGSLDAVITLSSSHGWTRELAKLMCREAGGLVSTVLPPRADMHQGFVLSASDTIRRAIESALLPLEFRLAADPG